MSNVDEIKDKLERMGFKRDEYDFIFAPRCHVTFIPRDDGTGFELNLGLPKKDGGSNLYIYSLDADTDSFEGDPVEIAAA